MKNYLSCLLTLVLMVSVSVMTAQNESGKLDKKTIREIQSSFKNTSENRALINAVTHNDIKNLAKSRENEGKVNHLINTKVKTHGISNQRSSGRCWLYTGLNTLKPMVLAKYDIKDFEFSQTYNFFWDQFEKANLFLEIAIATAGKPITDRKVEWMMKNPIGDGGQWTTFADVVKKYGVVPASAMPDTYQSKNTRMMSRLLARKLREDAMELRDLAANGAKAKNLASTKIEMLKNIYRMLVLSLGEPPQEFVWQYETREGKASEAKTYTPEEFFKEVVGVNVDDYVMFMNDPSREYYKLYEVEFDRNLVEGANWKYINLPNDVIKKFAVKSIQGNEAMYFSCDVGKQFDGKEGYLDVNLYDYDDLMGVKFGMDKSKRIQTFDSGSSHGMALVGVNVLDDGTTDKWLLENSWGAAKGNHGYLTMTDGWFNEYMFRLVINKKYIDADVLKILNDKATLLPPWDPMFAPEE
jgi:bleomycin hydrolase